MALTSCAILSAPTSLSVTGGTSKAFALVGENVANGVVLADTVATDHRLREKMILKSRTSSPQPDGTYSKEKREVTQKVPHICADGVVRFNVYRYSSEVYPETSTVVAAAERLTFAQTQFDAEFDAFHSVGSLA